MGCLLESSWFTNCFVRGVRGSDMCFFSLSHYNVLTSLSFQHPVVLSSPHQQYMQQGAPRCICIAWSQSEKKNVTLKALPGWSSAGRSYWYYKMSETATSSVHCWQQRQVSVTGWCCQATSGTNHHGRSLCRRLDNLNETAEINSITYKLQKHAWVPLGVTSSLFSHTFPVLHAWVHLHGYITRRTVLLSSLPFLRCLTSFCQTALLRSFFSSGQMDILWLS